MAHMRMLDKEPSAIITTNGNERKVYQDGQIFINDGENFEIRFFNPLQEKIGVEIIFNGIKKNDGLLVLRPGEDITLDRFLEKKKKMKYETYTIDGGSESAVKAAELNGLVEFKFYKEKRGYTTFTINNFNYTFNGPAPGPKDPTIRILNPSNLGTYIFPDEVIRMGHGAWVRKDIRKKLENWSAKDHFKDKPQLIEQAVQRWENWKEGENAIMLFNVPENNVYVRKLETKIHKFEVPWLVNK